MAPDDDSFFVCSAVRQLTNLSTGCNHVATVSA